MIRFGTKAPDSLSSPFAYAILLRYLADYLNEQPFQEVNGFDLAKDICWLWFGSALGISAFLAKVPDFG